MKKIAFLSKFAFVALSAIGLSATASALPTYTYFYDSATDAQPGTFGGPTHPFEAYSGGFAIENGNLYIQLITGFNPTTSAQGADTYSGGALTTLSLADLRIKTATNNFGLALSTHSGQVSLDPNEAGLAWRAVNQGNLYSNALFSTGTYESYIASDAPCTSSNGLINRCSTMIADYKNDLGAQTLSFSLLNGGGSVQVNPNGTNRTGVWSINAIISLASLGLSGNDVFDIMWSVAECGNDYISFRGSVPEPTSVALLGAGLLGLGARKRKRA